MKVSFSEHFNESEKIQGYRKFGVLLKEYWKESGRVTIVNADKPSDIHLTCIQGQRKSKCKNILRLDNIYYDTPRIKFNAGIADAIRRFDGIVYQSGWSKLMIETMLKVPNKKCSVIYNGTCQKKFKPHVQSQFDKTFVCSAVWRPNKRLMAIVKAFRLALAESNRNLGLYIIGPQNEIKDDDHIKCFTPRNFADIIDLYAQSDYMCHICHLESCSNSVVEGLSAHLPVIHNNIGGTPEIVQNSGIKVNIDEEFDFKAIKKIEQTSNVNVHTIKDGMLRIMDRSWKIVRDDLDISVSANKYEAFFESFL